MEGGQGPECYGDDVCQGARRGTQSLCWAEGLPVSRRRLGQRPSSRLGLQCAPQERVDLIACKPGRRHRWGLGDRPGARSALSSVSRAVPSQASPEGESAPCSPWASGNDEGRGRGRRARPTGPSAQPRAPALLLLDSEGTERTETPAAPPRPHHARRRCSAGSVRPLRTEATRAARLPRASPHEG